MTHRALHLPLAAACLLPCAGPAVADTGEDPISLGPLGGSAITIVVNEQDPDELIIVKYTKGMFRSFDGGATFAPEPPSVVGNEVRELYVDPQDDQTLYAIEGTQVFRSTDFGANWTTLGLAANDTVRGLALPSSGSTLLAYDFGSVYRSTDGGANWSIVATETVIDSLEYAPSDPSIAYFGSINGVWRSSNGGASFTDPGPFDEWAQALTVSPTDPDVVFVGTPFAGVQRSTDGGQSFQVVGTPEVNDGNAEFFGWEPAGSRLWYAMLDRLAYTPDQGTSWTIATDGWPENTPIPAAIAFDSIGGRYLGCEGGGLNDQSGGGLYRMPAGETAWEHIAFLESGINDVVIAEPGGLRVIGIGSGVYAGPAGETVVPTKLIADIGVDTRAVAIDPSDATRWVTGGVGAFFDNAQVYVTEQNGELFAKTYERFGAGRVESIQFDPFAPTTVLAGLYPGGFGNEAILRSTDAGQNWIEIAGTTGWATRAIAFDPHTSGRVLQLSENNQWSGSLDGGQSWLPLQPAWPGTGPATFLEFDPFEPGVLYRGDTGVGLQRSDNDGASWTPLGVTLQYDSGIELHPDVPGLLWVSDANGKILLSTDRGDSFSELWDVHLDSDGASLALDTSTGGLLIGTTAASTWEQPLASPFVRLGDGSPGTGGVVPRHFPSGGLSELGNATFALGGDRVVGGGIAVLAIGTSELAVPIFGGTSYPFGVFLLEVAVASGTPGVAGDGAFAITLPVPSNPGLVGLTLVSQFGVLDAGAADPSGFALSPGLRSTILP